MTTKELKSLPLGARVVWDDPPAVGIVRGADHTWKRTHKPVWIEWEDHQRTEEYDDWALAHVSVDR